MAPDSPEISLVGAVLAFAQTAIPLGRVSETERTVVAALGQRSAERPELRRVALIIIGQQGRIDDARRLIESLWQSDAPGPGTDIADRLAMLHEHVGLDFQPFPLEWNLGQLQRDMTSVFEQDRRALALARAYLATRTGDFEQAKTGLVSLLDRWRDDPEIWKAWLDWAVAADRPEQAREALDHLPARMFDGSGLLELRAWFGRKRQDFAGERRWLEQLVAIEPARSSALSRLFELTQQAGDGHRAAEILRSKDQIDAVIDRYGRLYREDRYADHLEELARLADTLGRRFEARSFWELLQIQQPSHQAARDALDRLRSPSPPAPLISGTLAQLMTAERSGDPIAAPRPPHTAGSVHGLVPFFESHSRTAGLNSFVQRNGDSSLHQLPETFSGGVGLLDFDGDGLMDVYCVQGGRFPPGSDARPGGDRLFRNRGDGTFDDVSGHSRIESFPGGYGHGIAIGDYDNDAKPDLFVTRWRSYALYRNRGDGTFEDKTMAAGLAGDRDWPTSSAFADLDNDGDLDLYVCHYGIWDTVNPRVCKDPSGAITIACDPRSVASLPDHVFRNDGGRFVDVTDEAGFIDRDGRGLGVVAADLDGDGLVDLFVANDSTANFLFRNLGGFRFEEVGHSAGVAANAEGGYQAGMGVACGDLDGDGLPDLAVTNFYGESTSFFHNLGHGLFADHGAAIGLVAPSRYVLGFGAAFLDANNDGRLDLLTANGHVSDIRPLFPYAMTPQLYLGDDSGRLAEVTAEAGPPFQELYVGRGLAVGDLDNDGRLDAVIVAQNEPLVYFHNQTDSSSAHSITCQLEGVKSNRDGVGALVTIVSGGRKQIRQRNGGGSFQSAADPRLHFGIGRIDSVDSVEVRWPSGQRDRFSHLGADKTYRLIEGASAPKPVR